MTDAPPAGKHGTPDAEFHVDEALVRHLLEDQHTDLAQLPLRFVDSGWDNVTYRLGDDLAVRVPRRTIADTLIANEQDWLPKLAQRLPLPVPTPLRLGKPTSDYPWRWSILPWLEGRSVDLSPLDADQGKVLGGFLRTLHVSAPADAPLSEVRGVALSGRIEAVGPRMARLEKNTKAITPRIKTLWQDALAAPLDAAPCWLHGDLHARNVLAHEGRITGVIDWGDMCAGDPACDLSSLWMLLPNAAARDAAHIAYGEISEATWARAKGWAVLMGTMLLDSGLANTPQLAAMGKFTLQQVLEG